MWIAGGGARHRRQTLDQQRANARRMNAVLTREEYARAGAAGRVVRNARYVLLPGLRDARLRARLTRPQLAAQAGLGPTAGKYTLMKLELGRRRARPATAQRLAHVLNVDIATLAAPPGAAV